MRLVRVGIGAGWDWARGNGLMKREGLRPVVALLDSQRFRTLGYARGGQGWRGCAVGGPGAFPPTL